MTTPKMLTKKVWVVLDKGDVGEPYSLSYILASYAVFETRADAQLFVREENRDYLKILPANLSYSFLKKKRG